MNKYGGFELGETGVMQVDLTLREGEGHTSEALSMDIAREVAKQCRMAGGSGILVLFCMGWRGCRHVHHSLSGKDVRTYGQSMVAREIERWLLALPKTGKAHENLN